MSDSVRFKESQFHDCNPPLTLEDAIRKCAVFAGIHDFDFRDEIDEDFADLSAWTVDTTDGTTWVVATGSLVATGGGNPVWYQGIHDTEVPPSFVASFDLVSGKGAFVLRGETGASDCYIVWWDDINCGIARVDAAKASTDLIKMPYGVVGPARVQIAAKWRLDSVDGVRKWLQVSLFVDGQEKVCYNDDVGGTSHDWTGDGVGFAVTGANILTVDNLTISEIARIVDYTSVDPGENAAVGMSRAIGTTRLVFLARYDGTLRIWRPGNRTSDWTIPVANALSHMSRKNKGGFITHIRTVGVLHAVDRFDDTDGEISMHRFAQSDDPNLLSESETYVEAGYQLSEAKERAATTQLGMPLAPLAEPHDRVTYDGDDYRVTAVHNVRAATPQGPQLITVLELQQYIAV